MKACWGYGCKVYTSMSAIVGAGHLGQSGIRNKKNVILDIVEENIQMHPTEPIKHAVRKGRI